MASPRPGHRPAIPRSRRTPLTGSIGPATPRPRAPRSARPCRRRSGCPSSSVAPGQLGKLFRSLLVLGRQLGWRLRRQRPHLVRHVPREPASSRPRRPRPAERCRPWSRRPAPCRGAGRHRPAQSSPRPTSRPPGSAPRPGDRPARPYRRRRLPPCVPRCASTRRTRAASRSPSAGHGPRRHLRHRGNRRRRSAFRRRRPAAPRPGSPAALYSKARPSGRCMRSTLIGRPYRTQAATGVVAQSLPVVTRT